MAVVLERSNERYIGLSTDTKPTSPPAGSLFWESDTGATYVYTGSAWALRVDQQPMVARKAITFDGAAGTGEAGTAVTFFDVTGEVILEYIVPYCTGDLTESAPTATIALGTSSQNAQFVAATNAVDIDSGEFWMDTAPDAGARQVPASNKESVTAQDIIATIAAANVTGGTLEVTVWWRPLSADGLLAAA